MATMGGEVDERARLGTFICRYAAVASSSLDQLVTWSLITDPGSHRLLRSLLGSSYLPRLAVGNRSGDESLRGPAYHTR